MHSSTGFISDISLRKPDWRAGSQIRTNGLHLQKSCSNHDNFGCPDQHWKCFDTSKLPKLGNQAGVVHTGIDWASPYWHWFVDAQAGRKPVANGVAASHLLSAIAGIWPLQGHFISFFHLDVHSSTGFISDISLTKPDWRAMTQANCRN